MTEQLPPPCSDGGPQHEPPFAQQPPVQYVPEVVPVAVPRCLLSLSKVAQATRSDYPEAAEPARSARRKVGAVWDGAIGAAACAAIANGGSFLPEEYNTLESVVVGAGWIGAVAGAAYGLHAYITARSMLMHAFELRDAAIEAELRRRYAETP